MFIFIFCAITSERAFEPRVVILRNWLPIKAEIPNLSYYLTHSLGKVYGCKVKAMVSDSEPEIGEKQVQYQREIISKSIRNPFEFLSKKYFDENCGSIPTALGYIIVQT